MANTARELKLEEELARKKQAAPAAEKKDVFSTLGNEGVGAQVDEAKRTAKVPEEKAPMQGALGKAMEETPEKKPEEVKKKEAELTELKKEEAPGEQTMSHRRALTEALSSLEKMMSDSETLKELVRPELSSAENASRVLAEFAWRMSPSARQALALADNSDLSSAMVISTTSIKHAEAASPLTAELGTFAPIAYQQIEEAMHNVGPLHQLNNEEELDLSKARRAFRPVISNWRLSISGLAFT